jgi:hypothetical protein
MIKENELRLNDRKPNPEEGSIRVDGMGQVLEMLKVADRSFRESLLRRIYARDPRLAAELLRRLAN